MASYQGKLLGIPYRVTASILNYQKQLLADAGFTTPPGDWDKLPGRAQATTKPPERYGLGIWGRQGPAMVGGFSPFLRGNGGRYFDPATCEIEINDAQGGRGAGILRRPDDAVQGRRPRRHHLGVR